MPGFIDTIKKQADTLDKAINPFRKAGDAMEKAVVPTPDPTGGAEARARGDAARDEAIARGKGIKTVTVDDSIKKIP